MISISPSLDGWRSVRFDQIMKRVDRRITLDDDTMYDCVGVRWYGMGAFRREKLSGINIMRKQQWVLRSGDVVYNKLFAWKGAFAIADGSVNNCIVSDKFPTYEADVESVDPNYLRYYFQTSYIQRQAEALSKGAAAISKLTLNPPQFWELTIPLPPLPEQQRIVAQIEELARRVEEARGLRRAAVEEAEQVSRSAARNVLGGVKCEPTRLVDWVDNTRNAIQTGPFGAQLGSGDFLESGHPVITIGNVQYDGLRFEHLKYVSEVKAANLQRYTVKEGDLLFARMGTVGRSGLVPKECEGWIYNYHLIRVALDRSRIEPRYVIWIIRASQDVEEYLDDRIRGATREGVNSNIVASIPCRVPAVEEQREMVAYLDGLQAKVDELRRLQAETQKELDALMPSILAKAFAGEL